MISLRNRKNLNCSAYNRTTIGRRAPTYFHGRNYLNSYSFFLVYFHATVLSSEYHLTNLNEYNYVLIKVKVKGAHKAEGNNKWTSNQAAALSKYQKFIQLQSCSISITASIQKD